MTILGVGMLFIITGIVFMDMFLSTKETYTFELVGWQVFAGILISITLIVMPQDKMIELIEKIFSVLIRRKDGKNN